MTVLITNRNDNMPKRSKTFFAQSFFYKTLLFFLIFVPFLQSTYAQDTTLQAHYKFDEGTGVTATDSSGNNRNGTIKGATWTTGKNGGALSFNGTSNYVSISPLNYDEVSVSAWFYRNSVDTVSPDTIFGGWSWNKVEGYGLYFDQYSASQNTIRFIVTSQTSGGAKTQKYATKNLITSTGKWYHVAGTYNKITGEQKLYVDGQLVDTQTHPAGNTIVPYTYASYMAIGALTSNYGNMDGKVDEVQVSNRALNAQEVLSLFNNAATPDTTPPTVSATSPVRNATGVAVNSGIAATFSEAMDAATITTATFSVSDGGSNVNGAVSYSGTTATFMPSGSLSSSTTYTATITKVVTDVAGNAMTANYIWSFTTGGASPDTTPPTVSATSPVGNATGVAVNSGIAATFSEAMDAATITTATFSVSGGGSNVNGAVSYSGTTATFTPSGSLSSSTTYTATITTGVKDVASNAMTANYIWSFTTTGAVSDTTLQAHYKFDEGTGVTATDSSGNNRNGTIKGATWTTGKNGGALSFNGTSNYVSISPLNYDEVSVSAWFYRNSVDTVSPDTIFGGWSWNKVEGYGLYFDQYSASQNTIRFIVTSQTSGGAKTQKYATKNLITSTGKWYHVAGTYNKITGEQKLYVDGQLVDTQTHPAGNTIVPYTYASYMAIGALTSNYGNMDGKVDEVQVSNRALNAQEVLSLFNNAATPDTTPPTVSATSPVRNATGVAVNSGIAATFSEAMDAATITTATFSVSDGGSNVNGAVSYSGTTATFMPSGSLSSSTTYTATITKVVTDVAGNAMTANYIWSFTTGGASPDTTPPTVSATSPVNNETNVKVESVMAVTFSEAMDPNSIKTSTLLVNDGNNNIEGTVSYAGTMATFTPSGNLNYSTPYTATITTGVKDAAGNAMLTDYTWNFMTGVTSDITPPTVSVTSPVNNETNVEVERVITVTFSEAMDPDSIKTSTFLVNDGNKNIGGPVSYSGTTATFTPSGNLNYSTTYTATITTGVKDAAGNAMTANYTWSFTTVGGVSPEGMQAYYRLNEGTGATTADSSGHNRNGTSTGITGSTWTTGKFGGALSFDNTKTYVSLPLLNDDEISVSAWFYRYSADTAAPDTIFGGWSWNSGGQGYGLYFDQYSGSRNTIRFIVTSQTSEGTKTLKHATKDLVTSTGKWYHVAGTYNKTTGKQKLYVDGQLVNTQIHPVGNTIVPYTAASYMAIGALTFNYGHIDGRVDEVRVYNRALSDQEVLSLRFYNTTTLSTSPLVRITTPDNYYLQENSDLFVQTETYNLEQNHRILFVLDSGTANEQTVSDYTEPYEVIFTNLSQGEHVIDAFVVDDLDNKVSDVYTRDTRVQIGIGDYHWAMGDSITRGIGDDDPSDDTSQDGRNNGGGYTPVLNDLLTAERGYPQAVFNEGVGGSTSVDGYSSIQRLLRRHPNAGWCLVQYGTNDANPLGLAIPSGLGLNPDDSGYPGTFKDNMQKIIDAINSRGQKVCLAKAPIALGDSRETYQDPDLARRNVLIKQYNQVIDEFKNNVSNNIVIIPPDFYSYFNYSDPSTGLRRYEGEYADILHPNGIGYRSMSNLWFQALTQ